MITIKKHTGFYEATFLNGNLLAFNLTDLLSQLQSIYNIQISELFTFKNLN